MPRPDDGPPRGAADLVERWAALPAGVARWTLPALPPDLGLGALSDTLRGLAWREHCRAAALGGRAPACADAGTACQGGPGQRCLADTLFPLGVGGGIPARRMATMFVRWLPAARELRLLALGEAAVPALDWAQQVLQRKHGLQPPQSVRVLPLGELFLPVRRRWQLNFITPWVAGKAAVGAEPTARAAADAQGLHHELCEAMVSRAHKLTALSCRDADAQRLGGHLAHYVGRALLPGAVRVLNADLHPVDLPGSSRGNRQAFIYRAWVGSAELDVAQAALPWLSLLALCGGGANADKGFGAVEFTPV